MFVIPSFNPYATSKIKFIDSFGLVSNFKGNEFLRFLSCKFSRFLEYQSAFLDSEIYQRRSRSIKLSRSSYIVVHAHTLNENKFKQQVGYNRIVQRT